MPALRVVAAPNALKGSLTARAAAAAIARGVRAADPGAVVAEIPIADGGDGTREVLVAALGGEELTLMVQDPLGRPTRAACGYFPTAGAGVVDVASASGLALLAESERDPWRASSYGTGELVRALLERGCRKLWLGVGGSATVDGGTGLLAALGARFLDPAGELVEPGGAGLLRIARLDASGISASARAAEIVVLSDVESPLVGPNGAARVFAPQKGADAETTAELERGLEHLADVLERDTGRRIRDLPRAGASGGVAGALHAVLGAELVPGVDRVLDWLDFDARLDGADLVISAEGRLDAQSLWNKGPFGVAVRAGRRGVPTVVLAGAVTADFELDRAPFAAALSIARESLPLAAARPHAAEWLAHAAEQAVRLFALGRLHRGPAGPLSARDFAND